MSLVSLSRITMRNALDDSVTSARRTHAVDWLGRSGIMMRSQSRCSSTIGMVIG